MAKKEPLYPHIPKSQMEKTEAVPSPPEYIDIRLQEIDWRTVLDALGAAKEFYDERGFSVNVEEIASIANKIQMQGNL